MNRISKASSDLKDNLKIATHNVKDKITFNSDFNKDDELIDHYKHDIEKCVKGLSFIKNQTKRIGLSYWPRLFKLNLKLVDLFLRLLGESSLHFKGIEQFYEDFDKYSAELEVPLVHPKERELLISSVNEELLNYRSTIELLSFKVKKDWDIHVQQVKMRVDQMNSYLKDTLKLIKKRQVKQLDYNRTHHKVDKLQKKNIPLDEKEHEKLNSLDSKLKSQYDSFEILDNKLKTILPHVLTFLDEFIEDLTKLVICQQLHTLEEVSKRLKHFSTYHGFLAGDNGDLQSYEAIANKWESAITGTRLQIESFIGAINSKNPDLINKEIDEKDKTLSATKMWNKVSQTVTERAHKVKPKDHTNGVFNDYLALDPLKSFLEYNDPQKNRSETYHPTRKVDIDDIIVSKPPASPPLPPLPPRSNTKPLPMVIASKVTTPLPPIPNSQSRVQSPSVPKYAQFHDPLDLEEEDEDDTSSIISDSSFPSVSSISSEVLIQNSTPNLVERDLTRIYNGSKNERQVAPIPDLEPKHDIHPYHSDIFDKTSSITYKLNRINNFFGRILDTTNGGKKLIAKYDFDGKEPGDLSFSKGDVIEIVCDFQNIDTLYINDDKNWLIGRTSSKNTENFRMGFVPSNYLAAT
ncbi:uncharacterized protein CANTADRAFT_5810 [Suhomyces tanzawaensis NRRL Y-17324]|uniref:SH3 domain-containing protein n=1 Tax=Suhomyces tanzawaensis NRRL Y-17324 TaxID=984487 RepID=A0A1E4SL37_9ASCO|nr:uncharacterized protein CANTADRAFT_5810 [Suhomyces tanzawaensis NRRL Y-17324]ODV80142.1 hypothetical protein CANTADRAFT_5810 [Suhomyces tanzawaensis NRRL Y-17324]